MTNPYCCFHIRLRRETLDRIGKAIENHQQFKSKHSWVLDKIIRHLDEEEKKEKNK